MRAKQPKIKKTGASAPRAATADALRRGREVLDIEIAALTHVRKRLDRAFTRAVDCLAERLAAGGKIVLTGVGKNIPIARKIAATLSSTGAPAVFLHPVEAMHGDLGIVGAGDALLALSYSGSSDELTALLPILKRGGTPVIALTGVPDSPLGRCAEIVVSVAVPREACPFNLAPTASTTATLAVGDALAMALMAARGVRREDYAKLHPGGAIGRTLLLRVADIMRKGDRLARVALEVTVREAVVAMTGARSGAVAVTDRRGRVRGVFTDGDLRRHLADGREIGARPIADVMTNNPIRIAADRLAVEALSLFEQHQIDDLLVVDGRDRLVGMVDLQDLPKMKLM